MGAVGSSRVMCDNVPGLVSRQRQLCRRHPEAMLSIGRGVAAWTAECQHQFRRHRWDCNALERGQRLLGRVLLRSESPAARRGVGGAAPRVRAGRAASAPPCSARRRAFGLRGSEGVGGGG